MISEKNYNIRVEQTPDNIARIGKPRGAAHAKRYVFDGSTFTMRIKKNIGLPLLVATIFTIATIFHRKYGGIISGGLYSESHDWNELLSFAHEFVGVFVIAFIGALIYFSFSRKSEIYMCLGCMYTFKLSDSENRICPKCNCEAEPLRGFFDRHPELKHKT